MDVEALKSPKKVPTLKQCTAPRKQAKIPPICIMEVMSLQHFSLDVLAKKKSGRTSPRVLAVFRGQSTDFSFHSNALYLHV